MSSYTTVYALDSKIQAPEIGDSGHAGNTPVDSAIGTHHFSKIYDALSGLGLITAELEASKEF